MDLAEKRKQQQREYYQKNLDQIRAKAKLYRARWTPEQRQRKRERDLAYYHRTKGLIQRKRRVRRQNRTEEQKDQERQKRKVRGSHPEARQLHRQHSKTHYQKHREDILSRQRAYYQTHSQTILNRQRQYRQRQRWTKKLNQFEPLHALAEICNQEWLRTNLGMCSEHCSNALTSADASANKSDALIPPTLS